MASRRKGRVIAFQAIYAWDMSDMASDELSSLKWLDEEKRKELTEEVLAFTLHIISGTVENIAAIDAMIKANLVKWDFSRLSRVDLAILRISAFSLMFQKDIPSSVTIDEAIEIAREYGADDSYRFVNGVLDGIRKNISQ